MEKANKLLQSVKTSELTNLPLGSDEGRTKSFKHSLLVALSNYMFSITLSS